MKTRQNDPGAAARNFRQILSGVKGVFFDLDGTLTDTVGNIIICSKETCASLNLPEPSEEKIKQGIGLPLEECMRRFIPEGRELSPMDAAARYREIFATHPEFFEDRLIGDLKPLFERLKALGLKTGFLSGRSLQGVKRTLSHTFLGEYADAAVGSSGDLGKPDPRLVKSVAAQMGVETALLLGVGDAPVDITLCKNAGCYSLGVLSGAAAEERLRAENPDFILPGACDLINFL